MSWWQNFKDAAGALFAFWILVAFSLLALSGTVLWFYREGEDFIALGVFALATFSGLICGQALGFARTRPWIVWIIVSACIVGVILFFAYLSGIPGAEYIAVFSILFALALNSGIWTMRPRSHMFAVWYPLMLAVIAIIIIAEETGGAEAWFAGRKWAIWSVPTFFILAVAILLTLAYLVAQQSYALSRWRAEGSGPDRRETRHSGKPRVRLSFAGWIMIVLLSGALTLVVAGVAPYLWRSAPSDDGHPTDGGGGGDGSTDGGGGGQGGDSDGGGGGGSSGGGGGGEQGEGEGGSGQFDGEGLGEKAKSAAMSLVYLLMLLLFMLLLALIAGVLSRPMRRAILLHHWQDPLWPVPPSQQIVNLWYRAAVSLQDLGFEVEGWEAPPAAALRANRELSPRLGGEVPELGAAAEVVRRAAFGFGVGDEDVAQMRAAVGCVVEAAEDRRGVEEWLRGQFRRIG